MYSMEVFQPQRLNFIVCRKMGITANNHIKQVSEINISEIILCVLPRFYKIVCIGHESTSEITMETKGLEGNEQRR